MLNDVTRCCRFCMRHSEQRDLIKYGVRSYAHFLCFHAYKDNAAIEKLPPFQRERFETWRKTQETKTL